jgi:hypothetical protein
LQIIGLCIIIYDNRNYKKREKAMAISFEDHIKSFKTLESKTKLDLPIIDPPTKKATFGSVISKIAKDIVPFVKPIAGLVNAFKNTVNESFIENEDQAKEKFNQLEKDISDAIEKVKNDLAEKQEEIEAKLEKYEHIKGNNTISEIRNKKHENHQDFDKATWDVSHTSLNYLELQQKQEALEEQLKKIKDFKADNPSLRDMQSSFINFQNIFEATNKKELSSLDKTKKNHALSNFDKEIITSGGDKAIEFLGAAVSFLASGVKKINSTVERIDNGAASIAEEGANFIKGKLTPDSTPNNTSKNDKSQSK